MMVTRPIKQYKDHLVLSVRFLEPDKSRGTTPIQATVAIIILIGRCPVTERRAPHNPMCCANSLEGVRL